MSRMVGVIAEDVSDVNVLNVIAKKIARKPYSIRSFVGHGCGRIKNKSRSWAKILKDRGCHLLIMIHDLDTDNIQKLHQALVDAIGASPIRQHVIVIPVRELEAWLLADHRAIEKTFKFKRPLAKIANPEAIMRPKERLRDIISQKSDRRIIYINTVHNVRIAENCAVANLRRCISFQPLERFLLQTLR